jgi:K+-sensing histidine kinase KdpD
MTAAGKRAPTHFAPAERAEADVLASQIEAAAHSPLLDGVLKSVGGLIAVLNQQRQVVAVNETLLAELGIADATRAFGLRPGETLGCVHAHDTEAGCGTGPFCSTCGAAVAIVGCIDGDTPLERTCALTVSHDGVEEDRCLHVRAAPVRIGEQRFVLLLLQDITSQEWRGALERTFFHDVNNLLTGLSGLSELLQRAPTGSHDDVARRIERLTDLLAREVAIQRSLSHGSRGEYVPARREVAPADVVGELQNVFSNHAAARNKNLLLPERVPGTPLFTDYPLLMRVLTNMLVNAFEASEPGGTVRLGVEAALGTFAFTVWNRTVIPETVRLRIFQRHFSTKQGAGRGLGTYAMKLFGEKFLGGNVSFTSTSARGTTFRLEIPAHGHEN